MCARPLDEGVNSSRARVMAAMPHCKGRSPAQLGPTVSQLPDGASGQGDGLDANRDGPLGDVAWPGSGARNTGGRERRLAPAMRGPDAVIMILLGSISWE